jgi:gas vesicle protein
MKLSKILTYSSTFIICGFLSALPEGPERPQIPLELKPQADAIKASVEAGEITHEEAREKIKELLDENKPELDDNIEEPNSRDFSAELREVNKAVRGSKLSLKQAKEKIKAIYGEMAEKGEYHSAQRPDKAELSDEVKTQLDGIKEKQEALHSELKESLADLGEDATKEEIKAAAQEFKEANKERFEAIKAEHEAIREELKAARPERPERPQIELSEELQAKVDDLKQKREELHEAQKEMLTTLKDASKEERKEIIEQFKEDNKAKHQEIKETAKALKEEIRDQVETEATRTSDL